jgi:septal ring factor EnvC (AmiA/AmiB activator)
MASIEKIKDWFTFAIAVITCIAGTIFWVQHSSDDRIARVESDIATLKQDIKEIEKDSREILRIVGKLEGMIDK